MSVDISSTSSPFSALLDCIRRENVVALRRQRFEIDDPQTRERFVQFLRTAEPAVQGNGGDIKTFKVAAEGHDYGLPEDVVFELMSEYYNPRCSPPWELDDLRRKIHNAYAYSQSAQGNRHPAVVFSDAQQEAESDENTDDAEAVRINSQIQWTYTTDRRGGMKLDPVINNVIGFLSLVPTSRAPNPLYRLFRLNGFDGQVEFTRAAPWHAGQYRPRTLTDHDLIKLKEYLTGRHLWVSTELVRDGVIATAYNDQYHPVRNWLDSLSWDGVPRLDQMLTKYAGAADTTYTRAVSKCTLIAAVARILEPGCKHDYMLILEGKQGIGKTEFVKALGGEWYADIKIDASNKDTIQAMQGAWILEASEMEFLSRSGVAELKRFLTLTKDKIRLPYDRCTSEFPRQSIFIGTVNPNPDGYFRDPTGNRRFWPVACRNCDIAALRADRDQLFAEAVARYRSGEKWHLEPEIEALALNEQVQRMEADTWDETIKNWLATENLPEPLTTGAIALYALNLAPGRIGQNERRRLTKAIRAAGYENVNRRFRGEQIRVWVKRDAMGGSLPDPLIDWL